MSAGAIEARLDALSGLYTLGLSLAEIAEPRLPRLVFDNRSLFIHSRASAQARGVSGPTAAGERDVSVFVGRAGKLHWVGDEFELLVDPDGTRAFVATRCILVGVIDRSGLALDHIPAGSEAVAVLRFVEGVPEVISNLPERDTWDRGAACRVVKAADWRRRPG